MVMLREVLSGYVFVTEVVFDFSDDRLGMPTTSTFFEALGDPGAVPSLHTVRVICPAPRYTAAKIWSDLECMVERRGRGSNMVEELVIEGTVCVEESWADDLERHVGRVQWLTHCVQGNPAWCGRCSWRT